jgi:hypothetical protein
MMFNLTETQLTCLRHAEKLGQIVVRVKDYAAHDLALIGLLEKFVATDSRGKRITKAELTEAGQKALAEIEEGKK